MKLLLVLHEFPKPSETFFVEKYLGLLERGLDVHLLVERQDGPLWEHFPALDRPELRARVHGRPFGAASWRLPFLLAGRLVRAFVAAPGRTGRAILHELARSPFAAPYRLALAAPMLYLRQDLIHFEFGSLAVHWLDWKHLTGSPAVVSFRGFDLNFYGLEERDTFAEVWKHGDAFHFLGRGLEARARRRGWGGSGLSARIPPSVDAGFFRPEERKAEAAGTPERPLRILSVGRLHWKKGYEYALAAVRRLVDDGLAVEYRIVGSGAFEEAVVACARELELPVQLLGDRRPEEVRTELQHADVLLHAAVSEGFCNAVLEAQAMALPVVCTDADGLAENVDSGSTGFVVPRRDPLALASAMRALAADGELRRRMGAAGRKRVCAEFTRERQLDAFLELYQRVLETR